MIYLSARKPDRSLIDGYPQIMLLTIDLDENLVDEGGIAITSVFSFQPA